MKDGFLFLLVLAIVVVNGFVIGAWYIVDPFFVEIKDLSPSNVGQIA